MRSNFRRMNISEIAVWKGILQFLFHNGSLVIYIRSIFEVTYLAKFAKLSLMKIRAYMVTIDAGRFGHV